MVSRRKTSAVLTLDDIQAKCEMVHNHWVWRGAMSHSMPVIRHGEKVISVRRFVLVEIKGVNADGLKATYSCKNPLCVAPHHTVGMTRAKVTKRGMAKRSPTKKRLHQARLAEAGRRRGKLTPEAVAEIRESSEPAAAVARKHGASKSMGSLIRRNKNWKSYATSPFDGLA